MTSTAPCGTNLGGAMRIVVVPGYHLEHRPVVQVGIPARVQVFIDHHHRGPGSRDPAHLGHGQSGIPEAVDAAHMKHAIERVIGKGQGVGVAEHQSNVVHAALAQVATQGQEHAQTQVAAPDLHGQGGW